MEVDVGREDGHDVELYIGHEDGKGEHHHLKEEH